MFSIRGRNITFKIFENDEKVILCYPNRPLSYYKDRLGDDEKFKKYIFATEENAYIDDKTLCEDIIGDCVCFRPNGLFVIYVKIFNDGEDDPIKELITRIPLSSTVKDLKKKLILKLDLNYDEIKVKYGEKELNEDDYIFSYKKKGRF